MVSGSSFPHFDANPNTGEAQGPTEKVRVATNQIHFGGMHRSWLDIPTAFALER